jgi:hypothetical protein
VTRNDDDDDDNNNNNVSSVGIQPACHCSLSLRVLENRVLREYTNLSDGR